MWVCGRKTVTCHFHSISKGHTITMTSLFKVNHDHERAFARLFHCKFFLLSSFPWCSLWKEITMHSSHLRSGKLCSITLRTEHLYQLGGILLHGRFAYSPPFMHLFNHIFISVWAHANSIYMLGYNPTLLS